MFALRSSATIVPLLRAIRRTHTQIHPNVPLELDPSFRELLRDADMSLAKHRATKPPVELESWPVPTEAIRPTDIESADHDEDHEDLSARWKRKSPQARFGSTGLASIALPTELQHCIDRLIQESDKTQLRSDAKRLFLQPLANSGDNEHGTYWTTDMPKYSSPRDERVSGPREGLAFATLSIPPHFISLTEILAQLRVRLGREWQPETVVDFGSQVGSAFWASLHAFMDHGKRHEAVQQLAHTTIKRYLGIENRTGLNSIHRKLMQGVSVGDCGVTFKKWWREFDLELQDEIKRSPEKTLAISAFNLSQLPTAHARKQYIHELWSVGAETMVIVDQGTRAGFECVAQARDELLSLGSRAFEHGDKGAHVVAPCPHDGTCPLLATKDSCFFVQRIQRPAFLRKTKHAKKGHEDTSYSYVVIRRGSRPPPNAAAVTDASPPEMVDAHEEDVLTQFKKDESNDNLSLHLQTAAYHWPRVVYPPLKRSGHIILDTCTPEANISRIIFPRSQGKQVYYDARKSSWGDIFPHEPKNPGVVRDRGIKRLNDFPKPTGQGGGKSGDYDRVVGELKAQKQARDQFKRERRIAVKLSWKEEANDDD